MKLTHSMRQRMQTWVKVEALEQFPTSLGGYQESWVVVARCVCFYRPLTSQEKIQANQLTYPSTHRLYTNESTISPGHRISVVSTQTAEYYRVTKVHDPMNAHTVYVVEMEKIDGPDDHERREV